MITQFLGDGMKLMAIDALSVYNNFPSFFQEHTQFFLLNHHSQEVGIYGIKTIDQKICEISLYVFQEFRFKLPYRQVLKLVLQHPFILGFDKILIWTNQKSVETLLRQCQRLGVREMQAFDDCVWFVKERVG